MSIRDRLGRALQAIGGHLAARRVTEDVYATYGVAEYLHREAIAESASFIKDRLARAVLLMTREDMFDYAIRCVASSFASSDGLCLEFGVATGGSINYFGKRLTNRFYGFDTFEGLPGNWYGWNLTAGAFDLKGQLPPVPENVTLIKGRIEQTLSETLLETADSIAFMHIDTDLYEPARIALQACRSRLKPGAIILFDEFHSYTGWRQHEFRALSETFAEDEYEFVAFSNFKQALIRLRTA